MQILGLGWFYCGFEVTAITHEGITVQAHGSPQTIPLEHVDPNFCSEQVDVAS